MTKVKVKVRKKNAKKSKVIPIQGTVAHERYRGPATRKASLLTSRNEYRQFFYPQGQWVQKPSVFWTGGELVVAISAGQGKSELTITGLRQRGSTLIATIEKTRLPKFIGNGAAAYHAVKIKASDLLGPVTKIKVRVAKVHKASEGPKPGNASGLKGRLNRIK